MHNYGGAGRQENGIDVSIAALLPAFLFACAVAWRLAKFNISTDQAYGFRGVPSPAAGLLVSSFPLIIWYEYFQLQALFTTPWFLYAVIAVTSYLMNCNIAFMAFKFRDYSLKNNMPRYLLVVLALVAAVFLGWFAVPVIFVLYLVLSLFVKHPAPKTIHRQETLDVTV